MKKVKVREDLKHLLKELDLLKYPAIEIGTAEGLFSRDILNWGVSKLYSIDSWQYIPEIKGDGNFPQSWHDDNYNNAKKLLAPFGKRSEMIKGFSWLVADKIQNDSVGFIHLDGDHTYKGVLDDLSLYYPKIINGGIVSGHDYLAKEYGVNQAVSEFVSRLKSKGIEITVHTIPDIDMEHAGFWFQKK